jgi:ribosomal protein S18 acetylase RimI-like enzyme
MCDLHYCRKITDIDGSASSLACADATYHYNADNLVSASSPQPAIRESLAMATKPKVTIEPAQLPRDHEAVNNLLTAYAHSLAIDLSFQNFDAELASLPGKYATATGGELLLASISTSSSPPAATIIGCAALRAFAPYTCEIKRLYVVPEARSVGAGRMLLEAMIERARALGYQDMLLDTLPSMLNARKLYGLFGFEEVEPYYDSPVEGTCFMRLKLGTEGLKREV